MSCRMSIQGLHDGFVDEEVDIQAKKMKYVEALKYSALGLQWTEENNIGINTKK